MSGTHTLPEPHFVPAPHGEPLEADTLQLWRARIDGHPDAAAAATLDASERERAARFRFEPHRDRYVAAHAALRRVLGGCCGRDPADLRWIAAAGSKPALDSPAGHLEFNLSHSGAWALIGVTRGVALVFDVHRALGVDVEHERAMNDQSALVQRHWTPDERAGWHAASEAARTRAFFVTWTRKEACLKLSGEGLARAPADCETTSGDPARWQRVRGLSGGPGCELLTFSCAPHYVASIAASRRPSRVDWYDLAAP
jgi:4'-phosphopantetheinyl transferase